MNIFWWGEGSMILLNFKNWYIIMENCIWHPQVQWFSNEPLQYKGPFWESYINMTDIDWRGGFTCCHPPFPCPSKCQHKLYVMVGSLILIWNPYIYLEFTYPGSYWFKWILRVNSASYSHPIRMWQGSLSNILRGVGTVGDSERDLDHLSNQCPLCLCNTPEMVSKTYLLI